jgi:isochorismate pyruvate lyase
MEIKQCKSLEDVRDAIDNVDDEIIQLIAKRNQYIKQAAAFKYSVDEVKDDERVQKVLDKVRHKAAELGLSPILAVELYTTMIDNMVETEIAEFNNGGSF